MKVTSVTDIEGSKIQVHAAIRCAPLCGIRRLMLGVNTNVAFLKVDRLLLAESGSQNYVFPALLTSALLPEAAIKLIG